MKTFRSIARTASRALSLLAVGLLSLPASAASYPEKPVRLIAPYAAGGGVDAVARIVGQKLTQDFGYNVIVENRPGANAAIGTQEVARSAADGYTLLLGTPSTHLINPILRPQLGYDAKRDFVPITQVAHGPFLLLAHPSLPVSNVKEFVAYAKARPNSLSFGSAGIGSVQHLSVELFKLMTGVNMVHVPYAGSAPALTGLMGNHVQFLSLEFSTAAPQVKTGKLKALAIADSVRHPDLPDVPTVEEAGLKGFTASSWYGIFAPSGIPQDVLSKLSTDLSKALSAPDTREKLSKLGLIASPVTGAELDAWLNQMRETYGKVIRDAAVKVD